MTDESKNTLGPDSTMREIFDFIRPDEGCRVQAINLEERDDGRADLMVAITGTYAEASVIMANLMSYVEEMYEVAGMIDDGEIQVPQPEADDTNVVGMDGKPVDNEPTDSVS